MVSLRFVGCDVRKGCTIIGALWLVFSVLIIVGGPLTMRMFEQIKEEEMRDFDGQLTTEVLTYVSLTMTVFRTCFYGITTIAVADAIFSIMLIIGARKDKCSLVLSWVMEQVSLMAVWVVIVLAFAAWCFMAAHMLVGAVTVSVVALRIGVTLYSLLVVFGQYEFLRRSEAPANPTRFV